MSDAGTGGIGAWRSGTVPSGGEEIYWEYSTPTGADGAPTDGPLAVLTHGAGGTHAVWFQQVPALVAAGYRVVTWDSRGFGNSSFTPGGITPEAAAGDLAAILDHLEVTEPVHLVGQSLGGWYVTEFALANPARTRSISLCDTIGSLFTDELRQAMAEFAAKGGLRDIAGEAKVGFHVAVISADPTTAFLYQQLGSFHAPPLEEIGGVVGRHSNDPAAVAALGVPVMVLAGSEDQIFPPAGLKNMGALIPGSRWVEVAGAGHSPYFEQPAVFNEALLGFLADS